MNSPPWYPGANAGVSFGTTPPQNPVRGHFWWNGSTLWMWDGAGWVATGGAAAGGGTPPSPTPPANPQPGTQWFNGSTLFVWDGNAWIPVSQTKTYLQSTAPPAPNPGDLWYDGSVMRIWDGSTWELVGPGSIGPVPTSSEVFRIQTTSLTSGLPSAQWNIAPINGTPTVGGADWDVDNKRYQPKKAGIYMIQAIAWAPAAGEFAALLKNDAGGPISALQNQPVVQIGSAASGPQWVYSVGPVMLNGTTDFVRLWWWGTSFDQSYGLPSLRAILLP
jgi:hypothetical protein